MNARVLLLIALFVAAAHGDESPDTYTQLDTLLSANSVMYKTMADVVRSRQPYRIVPSNDFPLGNVKDEGGEIVIELNPRIPKDRQATILIWEMANAYQRKTFAEITRRARSGEIASHHEYGIRMELVEHGSHQLHRDVLEDLSRAGFLISEDFLYFIDPKLKSLPEYKIPSAHAYIEAQAKCGHTKHYEEWYYRIMGTSPEAQVGFDRR
jgi:hypothetical protein